MNNWQKDSKQLCWTSEKLNIDLKIILLGYQNYYVRIPSIMSNAAQIFNILANSILHNCFDNSTKLSLELFSDPYLAKF